MTQPEPITHPAGATPKFADPAWRGLRTTLNPRNKNYLYIEVGPKPPGNVTVRSGRPRSPSAIRPSPVMCRPATRRPEHRPPVSHGHPIDTDARGAHSPQQRPHKRRDRNQFSIEVWSKTPPNVTSTPRRPARGPCLPQRRCQPSQPVRRPRRNKLLYRTKVQNTRKPNIAALGEHLSEAPHGALAARRGPLDTNAAKRRLEQTADVPHDTVVGVRPPGPPKHVLATAAEINALRVQSRRRHRPQDPRPLRLGTPRLRPPRPRPGLDPSLPTHDIQTTLDPS